MPEKEPKPELSLKEKERRWSLLRERLKGAGLSALIVYGGTQLGVPVHYLTRVWGSKMNTVVFPVDGEPVLLVASNTGITGDIDNADSGLTHITQVPSYLVLIKSIA